MYVDSGTEGNWSGGDRALRSNSENANEGDGFSAFHGVVPPCKYICTRATAAKGCVVMTSCIVTVLYVLWSPEIHFSRDAISNAQQTQSDPRCPPLPQRSTAHRHTAQIGPLEAEGTQSQP